MALSAESFDDIVKPDKKDDYMKTKWDWLVNPEDNMAKRKPGLFKTVSYIAYTYNYAYGNFSLVHIYIWPCQCGLYTAGVVWSCYGRLKFENILRSE